MAAIRLQSLANMNIYGNRGSIVRLLYLVTALAWWIASGFGRLARTRCVTLCYHGVMFRESHRFRRQMRMVAGRVIATSDPCLADARTGAGPRVCITFDDAYANLVDHALPIIDELRIPVTIFAVPGNLGSVPRWRMAEDHPDASQMLMSAAQMQRAAQMATVAFGSHSMTHRPMTDLSDSEALDEMRLSGEALASITGTPTHEFAFPYGEYSERHLKAAASAGYERLFTLGPSDRSSAEAGRVIGRMQMSPRVWMLEFRLTIAGAYEWLPHLRSFIKRLRPATGAYGLMLGRSISALRSLAAGP